ncbi:unnamed protein product [Rotaria socialis]|uniref:LIM zinc-binding domain-containing protein n=3 Tax=Rotaria socialis TaxID=392032 RepID=A0A818EEA9_9BILA|nr:unnamed protein product [Rotaria socialis]CAF3332398.1 unnamed protein product [Rotaria socialis]CAF3336136.1 unnamed protein product [Rotaria socialis]CAF3405295.1 unnamed protein product [Rotaria socialis]CAF3457440.1 unnamed protein product [Rotaria socialis]
MSSSSPLSSKNNTFVQSQAQNFNQQNNSSLNSPMNINRQSSGLSSSSTTTTTRIVGPRPFYRSRVTPDPFDYTTNDRRENDYQQNVSQRRYSANQINVNDNDDECTSSDESLSIEFPPPPIAFSSSPTINDTYQFIPVKNPFVQTTIVRSDSGSSLSNSYLSDHEPLSPTITKHSQYRPITPISNAFNNNTNSSRPVISVSASQSPVITIGSRGSPNRSEIRFSSSSNPNKSTFKEILISRPDSPSISINRQGITNQPITYSNGNDNAFHISLGTPTPANQREISVSSPLSAIHMLGRTSPSIRQIEILRDSPLDSRYTSNVVANRFKPLIAFTSPNGNQSPVFDNIERQSPSVVNLPPTSSHPNSNPTPFTIRSGHQMRKEPSDVDQLTKLLMKSMNSSNEPNFFGMCARCNDEIVGEENGLVAMDRMYHVPCFTCTMCGCRLRGMHFYSMENKPYCEPCYVNSLEKCVVCARPITDRILRATGKPYHAECFCCVVCHKTLDGVPFTIDAIMEVHCIECFHQKFAPRCYVCHRPILPVNGQDETVRIVALDRSYHIDCYRCENCSIQFTSEEGCYPIDDHVFCMHCNRIYSRTMLGHA